jgi:hypothetical protein
MRKSHDFSKSVQNPYAKHLKKQITIRIDEETISYFKTMADEKGIPYQSLINLYLRDCASIWCGFALLRDSKEISNPDERYVCISLLYLIKS